MASQDTKDALDVLQDMYNEALIKTGKALRASRNEGSAQTLPSSQSLDLQTTLTRYHEALNDIDKEIVGAKAVLMRDLYRLQNKDTNMTNPQPVEAQTKSPMVVDIDSSPFEAKVESPATKPVAPFPDMGMGMDIPATAASTDFSFSTATAPVMDMGEMQPAAVMAADPPLAPAEESKSEDPAVNDAKVDAPSETFTDMQFTLAPAETDTSGNQGNQEQPFDMANFTSNDAGNGTIDLNTLLPSSTEQGDADPLASIDFGTGTQGQSEKAGNGAETTFDGMDFDNMEWGGADGSDFDFNINDDGTFNDLMTSHDNMNDMKHGQYDADFFGLNNNDNNDGT